VFCAFCFAKQNASVLLRFLMLFFLQNKMQVFFEKKHEKTQTKKRKPKNTNEKNL
jgi:hypothetical protein